jgi:O-methyltransferase
MAEIKNFFAIIGLVSIDPGLMLLALKIKRSRRTYLSYSTLYSLASNLNHLHQKIQQPLQIAEFGVGRGGSAAVLAWFTERHTGRLTLYDVFGRIPAPSAIDGERALDRYEVITKQEGEDYYGNVTNLLEVVKTDLSKICPLDRIEFVQGKYEETLPALQDQREFSLVHIDCDWYESSMTVYRYLQSRMKPGAIIQVDDYSNWEGSKRAFQDAGWLEGFHTHIVDGALVIDTSKANVSDVT